MKYEDYRLLDYILSARKPVSAQQIITHLSNEVEGFTKRQPKDGGLKNIQNRLKKLADCDDFKMIINVEQEGRRKLYSSSIKSSETRTTMSIEQACALLMSDKHLSAIAPTRLFQSQSEFQELITRAEAVVQKHQEHRLRHNTDIDDFLKRVTVVQRGQRLLGATVNNQVLECIANCIVKKRCINLSYNGKSRTLHPFGLVFRQPKIYLLAVDQNEISEKAPAMVRPRLFLCNRIRNATLSRVAHQVPEGFDVDSYVLKERLDMLAPTMNDSKGMPRKGVEEPPLGRSFTLRLRLIGGLKDNMIRDLKEFPLSDSQRITAERGTDNFLLTAAGMYATHSLVEWVMGRMERVEVLAPKRLRAYVKDKVAAMNQHYLD